jgi:hypothetical protein
MKQSPFWFISATPDLSAKLFRMANSPACTHEGNAASSFFVTGRQFNDDRFKRSQMQRNAVIISIAGIPPRFMKRKPSVSV